MMHNFSVSPAMDRVFFGIAIFMYVDTQCDMIDASQEQRLKQTKLYKRSIVCRKDSLANDLCFMYDLCASVRARSLTMLMS